MKIKTLILFGLLIFQIFAPLASLTLAQTEANEDFKDSDAFFKNVARRPRPLRNDAAKIEALLRRMTVEEKVGQMTQLTIDMVTSGDDQNVRIDRTKLEKAINGYGVGSILNRCAIRFLWRPGGSILPINGHPRNRWRCPFSAAISSSVGGGGSSTAARKVSRSAPRRTIRSCSASTRRAPS